MSLPACEILHNIGINRDDIVDSTQDQVQLRGENGNNIVDGDDVNMRYHILDTYFTLTQSCSRSLKRKGDNPFAFSRTKGGNSQSRNFCALLNSFISSPLAMLKQKQVSYSVFKAP